MCVTNIRFSLEISTKNKEHAVEIYLTKEMTFVPTPNLSLRFGEGEDEFVVDDKPYQDWKEEGNTLTITLKDEGVEDKEAMIRRVSYLNQKYGFG